IEDFERKGDGEIERLKKGRLKNFQTAFPYPKFVGRILVSDKISRIKLSDSRIRPTSAWKNFSCSRQKIYDADWNSKQQMKY
ncbi:hypothetical protein ACTHRC_11310, partial [Neisseria sp. P0001.S009]|uniref:hypothetical protein n=1 Tax=Neisseria sp. P0001.S009 TaxID=3436653 RepID=UPI003F7EABB7